MQDLIPERAAREHLPGSHSKVLLWREPPWALPCVRGTEDGAGTAEEPGAWSLASMQEECHLMEALTLSMSHVALLTIWLYLTELFSQRPTTHTQKRQLRAGSWRWDRSRHLCRCSCWGPIGPFPVKLFIGLPWSSGKVMFHVGKCLALVVEYAQGSCFVCSWVSRVKSPQ